MSVAYLLDFMKRWAYNRLPVTCVDDRDRNDLYYVFHGRICDIRRISRGVQPKPSEDGRTHKAIAQRDDQVTPYVYLRRWLCLREDQ